LAHVSGKEFAKTVIIHLDNQLAMAVLPANRRVAVQELRELTGCDRVRFATEEEFQGLFPDCEIGAMPPFGNLYGMEVYVAPELTGDPEIAFNAGTHTEVMRMPYGDFERIVHPHVMQFTT
jgi:Ala-tRNA(Pro) deacylase